MAKSFCNGCIHWELLENFIVAVSTIATNLELMN
jgi:hypothetical protein